MNPQDYQYPVDYLNQIATPAKKPGMSSKLLFIIGGGAILIAVLVLILAITSSNSSTKSLPTLAARLDSLQTIASDGQKRIKSSSLRATNSNLVLFLTNANHDLEAPLKTNGVDIKKLDKKLVAREKNKTLTDKLEDARLNGVYDRTYAREMHYQLQKLGALMQEVYSSTKSKSLKAALESISKNLTPIDKQLDEFTAATS